MKNPGFDPLEIEELKKECKADGANFVIFVDEEDDEFETDEDGRQYAHFQFIGKHESKEVIYDAVVCTLRMNHSSLVLEEAEKQVKLSFPNYVEIEKRKASYKADEESELFLEEIMEQLEDDEAIQVAESLEIDKDFEYGIGIDAALNVEEISDEVITKFVNDFNAGTLKLDTTLFSFKNEIE